MILSIPPVSIYQFSSTTDQLLKIESANSHLLIIPYQIQCKTKIIIKQYFNSFIFKQSTVVITQQPRQDTPNNILSQTLAKYFSQQELKSEFLPQDFFIDRHKLPINQNSNKAQVIYMKGGKKRLKSMDEEQIFLNNWKNRQCSEKKFNNERQENLVQLIVQKQINSSKNTYKECFSSRSHKENNLPKLNIPVNIQQNLDQNNELKSLSYQGQEVISTRKLEGNRLKSRKSLQKKNILIQTKKFMQVSPSFQNERLLFSLDNKIGEKKKDSNILAKKIQREQQDELKSLIGQRVEGLISEKKPEIQKQKGEQQMGQNLERQKKNLKQIYKRLIE